MTDDETPNLSHFCSRCGERWNPLPDGKWPECPARDGKPHIASYQRLSGSENLEAPDV